MLHCYTSQSYETFSLTCSWQPSCYRGLSIVSESENGVYRDMGAQMGQGVATYGHTFSQHVL